MRKPVAVATTGGDTVYNLVLTWNPHPDAFVAGGGRFEIRYKLSAETDWRPSFFVGGDLTFADVLSSSPNVSYDLQIRAVSSLGANVRSRWTSLLDCVIGSSGGVGTTIDWGSVAVEYRGAALDHASLLEYIVSFRQHSDFHEQCVERIFLDLQRLLKPEKLTVYARYVRRGGLDINPYRSTEEVQLPNHRLVRQ